jgi:pimeloyl-ACP methyl ester carboxylesterase
MRMTVNGASVHTVGKERTLPTLVFLHGAGMSYRVWTKVASLIGNLGYGTLMIDLPGHGESDGPPLPTIGQLGRWVAACVNTLNLQEPVLVGHSMGAIAALAAAKNRDIKLAGVIFCGIAERLSVHPDLLRTASTDRQKAEMLIAKWSVAAFADGIDLAHYFASQQDGVLPIDLKACDDYGGVLGDISEITTPQLFLFGAEDKMTPPKRATSLIAASRNAQSIELKGCGHMMQLEAPEKVAAAIDRFLKQCP